jgi:hypothetical protein
VSFRLRVFRHVVTFVLATFWGSCTGYRYLTGQFVLTNRQETVATTTIHFWGLLSKTPCWGLLLKRTGASKLNSVLGANHSLCYVGAFIQTQIPLFTNTHEGFKFEFERLTSTGALCCAFIQTQLPLPIHTGASNSNLSG